jgi:hypothetical protein
VDTCLPHSHFFAVEWLLLPLLRGVCSTFLKVLTGALPLTAGSVRIGETATIGYYEQTGLVLTPEQVCPLSPGALSLAIYPSHLFCSLYSSVFVVSVITLRFVYTIPYCCTLVDACQHHFPDFRKNVVFFTTPCYDGECIGIPDFRPEKK